MAAKLLIIDPQNDFCDIPGAALPVTGADADMRRLAAFMKAAGERLEEIVVTLDSHASVGVERVTFWRTADGGAVAPFTQITAQELRNGKYTPRDPSLRGEVLQYLDDLEAAGRYRLVVWPVHCVVGMWGHNIHEAVAHELAAWEARVARGAFKVLKGANPLTEQYSALRAEVPRDEDPATNTNHALVERAAPEEGRLFVAGEASSHCVKATVEHLFEEFTAEEIRRVVILEDCMSPVGGFEAQAAEFFAATRDAGAQIMSADAALTLLQA
jgi:nicotinamidase/pyrazinamidase